ncbi:MAG TPA: S8 family serine peptidase [Vitreimonas sp.]|nr:S8 family serine peptidase [Vitreimonas sp.]
MPVQFSRLVLIAQALALVILIIALRLFPTVFFPAKPTPLQPTASNPAIFIAPASPEGKTTLESKVIAEKLDLERKLIQPTSPQQLLVIAQTVEKAGGTVIEQADGFIVAEIPKEVETAVVAQLKSTQAIKNIEVDYPTFVTSDSIDWGVSHITAPPVWPVTQGKGVTVGVFDSGVDYTHPELNQLYSNGYDFVNDDSDAFDDHGHGTHVAGIIAARTNDSGYIGIAPQAQVVGVKVIGADGSGYISDLVDAFDWALTQDIQIINVSLGTTYDSQLLHEKITQLTQKGVVVVAAAGNNYGGPLLYPAAYQEVISVAASDTNNQLASFSNLGAAVTAPGVGITSTVPGGGYATWSGTSMAAPHVSGAIALMLSQGQTNVRTQLQKTAIDLGPAGTDTYFGYGMIDAQAATLGLDTLAPVVTFSQPLHQATVSGRVTVTMEVQDEAPISQAELLLYRDQVSSPTPLYNWTNGPYVFSWDTQSVAPGDYTLVAQAKDESGNIGGARVMVTVVAESASASPSPSPTVTPQPSPLVSTPAAKLATSSARRRDRALPTATPSASVAPTPSPMASANPSPQPASSPTSSPVLTDTPPGASGDHRQDQTTPAEENRQNFYHGPEYWPPVTNLDQRHKFGESQTSKDEKSDHEDKSNSRSRVKGVTTSWWRFW